MAEKVTFQQLDRINPMDTQDVSSRTIQRKFGKNNDYVEFHVYDQNDKLLYSIDNYMNSHRWGIVKMRVVELN